MKVNFCPNSPGKTGPASWIGWDSKELAEAMRQAFKEGPRERLVEIDIDRNGIRAWFESKQ